MYEANLQSRRMQRENESLTKQVRKLSDELEGSRAYIDDLLQRIHQGDDEWQMKEKEYEKAISNLKSQIRKGEPTVSFALYRKAVDEARARAIECQDKRLEITIMSRKVQALEKRLRDRRPTIETRPTPPEARHSLPNRRKVTPASHVKPVESCELKTPNVATKHEKCDRPPPPLLTPRISALREAGGRAGLCAKLKQMRRSPLATKN